MSKPVLYGFWRSSSPWRVRIALNIKGIDYEYRPVNTAARENRSDEFSKLNPMRTLPVVEIDGHAIPDSNTIMEYLEETRPTPALLPKDPYQRSIVRQIVSAIISGIQPLQNLPVLEKVGEEKKMEWAQHFITNGFEAVEKILSKTAGKYCYGDELTLADCVIVPQVYSAGRFSVDMSKFPTIARVNANLLELEAFKKAHANMMPDAPK
eukprot:TRINITY_DN922_c0_g2_i1.p1 TRINITY_DN922_c0_g2~~TRINITY_DN922_c0_g2_i1.p1  ORF type:complete len:209 (+),score=22.98 TRINITY_DN922_c0_g2_i1:93-719(+)